MNNLANTFLLKTYLKQCIAILIVVFSFTLQAQEVDFESGETYVIGGVSVSGNTSFNEQTVVAYSGLKKGNEIKIPGEDIANAIKKLWSSKLFSDIEVYLKILKAIKPF